ncbi:hypothetical protein [Streptomyces sp. ST2-7A]|uniref:hypothetical protein n=1 Tax=Streptomyces sp. ST2-7A TaxID=2907214 RepID=UPI001F45C72C|nr:hypothetical protein [Streptomyces sp. ST2-7A]MCE7081765.1 hypothetical protein [Streptomyces sp. ST2-7A]
MSTHRNMYLGPIHIAFTVVGWSFPVVALLVACLLYMIGLFLGVFTLGGHLAGRRRDKDTGTPDDAERPLGLSAFTWKDATTDEPAEPDREPGQLPLPEKPRPTPPGGPP